MQFIPLQDVLQRPTGKMPMDRSAPNINRDFEFPILRVETRRNMIVVVHRNHNSQKPRNLRHDRKLPHRFRRINGITIN